MLDINNSQSQNSTQHRTWGFQRMLRACPHKPRIAMIGISSRLLNSKTIRTSAAQTTGLRRVLLSTTKCKLRQVLSSSNHAQVASRQRPRRAVQLEVSMFQVIIWPTCTRMRCTLKSLTLRAAKCRATRLSQWSPTTNKQQHNSSQEMVVTLDLSQSNSCR